MAVRCNQCDSTTVWDDSVGSAVCTSCGSLADPTQSVLTSTLYGNDTAEPSLWDPSASNTLKSLRAGNNWDLAGQGKESRDRKNSYAMSDFIKSLAVSFNATGLSPRAITLFTLAKSASNFRWGQKSRTVAAACLAIALRESNRPDSIRDIASILNVPVPSVSREFMSITSALKLSLTLLDPSVHISTLQNHLASSLQEPRQLSGLPHSLATSLQAVPLRAAGKTATSITQLLARLNPDHEVLRLPVAPTACGIFILALEAEIRAVLNPLGDLAQFLGSPCHAAKSVVMTRYKIVQDEIARWVDKVPWLDKYESKGGRAKLSRRLIVARGLKDVIKFQEDIWQRQIKPLLDVDLGSDEDQKESEQPLPASMISPLRPTLSRSISETLQFLVDPLGCSISSSFPKLPGTYSESRLPLATYILTSSPVSFIRRPPTRLQLLAQERGGANEDQITDDDLFSPGELEGLLRDPEEVNKLRTIFGWPEGEDTTQTLLHPSGPSSRIPSKKRKRSHDGTTVDEISSLSTSSPSKRSRINMESFARFLANGNGHSDDDTPDGIGTDLLGLDEVVFDAESDSDDDANVYNTEHHEEDNTSNTLAHRNADDEELVVDGWRPPSPEGNVGQDIQYEEEYD